MARATRKRRRFVPARHADVGCRDRERRSSLHVGADALPHFVIGEISEAGEAGDWAQSGSLFSNRSMGLLATSISALVGYRKWHAFELFSIVSQHERCYPL